MCCFIKMCYLVVFFLCRSGVQAASWSNWLASFGSGAPYPVETVSLKIHRTIFGSDWSVYLFNNGAVHKVSMFYFLPRYHLCEEDFSSEKALDCFVSIFVLEERNWHLHSFSTWRDLIKKMERVFLYGQTGTGKGRMILN